MKFEPADFEQQVIERSATVPVLVDFWAPWCGPCRTLGPVLERLAEQSNGRWDLVKVNTEDNPDLAQAFNVTSIPAVKLFVNGEVVDEFTGALPEPQVRRFLDNALPSPHRETLARARELFEGNRTAEASAVLEPVVRAEPQNLEARVLLAQTLISRDPARAEKLLEGIAAHADLGDRAEAVRTLARLAQAENLAASLPPSKGRDSFLAAAKAMRDGDLAATLEALIAVIERDKGYPEDGARKAGKAIFQLLGPRHPLTERFFRAFSSALHA